LIRIAALVLAVLLGAPALAEAPRVLVIGDSLLAWHSVSGTSVADRLAVLTGAEVRDRSVGGARMIYNLPVTGALGLSIPKQFHKADREAGWDWIVVNGGGNDLWFGCGCQKCDRKLGKLISEDGQRGAIPKLVERLRAGGARVLWIGYLRSPGVDSPIDSCRDEGDILEGRIATLAETREDMVFLSIADMVPEGNRSFHGIDMIHPSRKASLEIARRIARVIGAR